MVLALHQGVKLRSHVLALFWHCKNLKTPKNPEQGTSRGGADIRRIVQRLSLWGISMLFVVGGNGVDPTRDCKTLSSSCWVLVA